MHTYLCADSFGATPQLFACIGCAFVKSEFSTKPDGRGLTELDLKRDITGKRLKAREMKLI
ncbi:MAG TPA: hypothetical protein DCE56_16795 [Cyanobacteria bacterium UBA8553]|nr:hypothetical protein [Cyanobacteria bacterium UBA8553]HAJ60941.1 hypothetical protein [Cyanobacteria bacterium UBA8543]